MDFGLTEEQKMIQALARDFANNEIVPVARENDRQEKFPWEVLRKMAELGLLAGPIPTEYGGMGLDYVSHGLITEEIGRACSSVRTTLSVHISLCQLTLLKWATEEQKRRYLPRLARGEIIGCFALTEPNVGSDAASIETTATRRGDGWVLNGAKTLISNGGVAGLAIIFAQTDKSLGHHGIGAFLVERDAPGFTTKDIHGKLGLRSSNTAELFFEDCYVPQENVLGQIGDGFKMALSALDSGRFSVAAGCVGIAQGCIDACIRYAQARHQFGRPIGSFQLVQELIAEMIVNTEAARLLVYRAAALKDKGLPNTRETSIAKYFASEVALKAANDAIQVHGGYGYLDEYPVERYMRDARVASLYEGTSQIQKLIIARDALGVSAFV